MDTTVGADPLVGQVLDGRYRIDSRVARGGMATVYVGRDLKLGRQVAVKVMHPNMAQDEDFVRRFMGEAKAAAALSHPNVVAVYDQGSSGQHVYLVMEYVPGRTLRELLNQRGRLGPQAALALMQHILAALAAAHRAGLVHRDVKPENVLLTDDGGVKVADFGLARAETASKQTKTGVLIGTVAYVAPEQVLQGTADARADVYAAGIMLFELLIGRQPHTGETPIQVAYKHVNQVVPPPSTLLPGIPGQVDALVGAATAHDPNRRPPDAGRFQAAAADVERTLPADLDQRLAQVPVTEPRNATAVMEMPFSGPGAPGMQQSTPPPGLPQRTNMLGTGLLPPQAPQRPDDSSVFNRILSVVTGKYVLIGIGLLAVIVLGWAVWYQTAGQYRSVPNVVGLSVTDAQQQLTAKGYHVTTGPSQNSKTVPKNSVMATDPKVGARVAQGGTITLIPSKGQVSVKIPDLKGQSPAQAQQTLQGYGFTVTQQQEASNSGVPIGQVTRTTPAAGDLAQPGPDGDKVTIFVSSGTVVPNVVGMSVENAKTTLANAGFHNVQVTTQPAQDGQAPDTVITQNPPAQQGADPSQPLTLVATQPDCKINIGPFKFGCNNPTSSDQSQVPNVVGMPFDQATQTLQGAGFQVNVNGGGAGNVAGQYPAANANADPGATIQIW